LDSQLYVHSVPIGTNGLSSNPARGEVYTIQHYVVKIVSDRSMVFYGFSGFFQK
jgi:hypothetical protein